MQEAGYFEAGALVAVLTAEPIGKPLDYRAPEGGCALGAFVEVPLGPRKVLGVVWGKGEGGYDLARVRAVSKVLDLAPMRAEMQDFLTRAADYTLTPLPQMLRLATRAPDIGAEGAARKVYKRGSGAGRMTEAREKVLAVFAQAEGAEFYLTELAKRAGVTPQVIKGMVASGAVLETEQPRDLPFPKLDPARAGKSLNPDQSAAAATLAEGMRAGSYRTTLLKGVTGSGKTEVYLEAVAECLRLGRQALVLLPEIALTAEFLDRVEARFGARPGEWHSGASLSERRRLWKMAGAGEVQLVVGARSALFLPFRDLGLIVIDEEHDGSYKQDEGVLYSARDMAVLRASFASAQVVLASATPSLETWVNAEAGKYARINLSARFGVAELPEMAAIDMREQHMANNQWISPALASEVTARLAEGEQAMLFLNRRGYAPTTVCRGCGHQIGCDHCDARMVEHRFLKRLVCHQCGETKPVPETCPACGVAGKLAPIGPGVERLAEEVAERFPQARLAVLSSDLFTTARALKEAIHEIAAGGADIIIGTQIVAKGHNFPLLTLVGVIDADLGLMGSDMRAAERTFQLMRQVAGRAGRAERKGRALLQSHQPDHPVIRAILGGDEEAFWRAEAEARRAEGVPPYGRMAGIILSGPDPEPLFQLGEALARGSAPLRAAGAELYGPAPAPIARVRGKHRVRMLIKAPRTTPLQSAIRAWLAPFKIPNSIRLAVDIDPQSFW